MFKRLAKSALAAHIASFVIGLYIRLIHATSRWRFIGREYFDAAAAHERGVILTFWHGRLLMAPTLRGETDRRVFMLISAHRDGEIIANGVKSFGVEFIRGSAANPKKPAKNKSGAPALTQMIAALKDGHIVGITPDGPRGPGMRANKGVIKLAQMTGAPIIPAAYSVSRGRRLNSWDKFLLAAPFSRGYYVAGAPITVPADADFDTVEAARLALEDALNAATAKADDLASKTGE